MPNERPIAETSAQTQGITITHLLWFFGGLATLGFVSMLIFAWASAQPTRVLGIGLFLAGASTLLGAFVGLLFGIPKGPKSDRGERIARPHDPRRLGYNTNLADISDWLTKALVGASLVEARQIGASLQLLFTFLGTAFSNDRAVGALVAGAITIHYLAAGFFVGYFFSSVVLRDVLDPLDT